MEHRNPNAPIAGRDDVNRVVVKSSQILHVGALCSHVRQRGGPSRCLADHVLTDISGNHTQLQRAHGHGHKHAREE